jgi:2',3'-cyclic-nucleotide 2'-phosphodiesterase
MKVLFLGDVVGRPGRKAVKGLLPDLKKKYSLDMVVANAENASGGLGLTAGSARELFGLGLDAMTSGNHIWKHREIYPVLDSEPRLLRPANYPEGAPGTGLGIYRTSTGVEVALINLIGRTFMSPVDCPFHAAETLLEQIPDQVRVRIVDFHAEATSEKKALACFLDGRVSAVFGTHTHVQTNDACILPGGTAFVSDIGMCGPSDSVIGMNPNPIVERFLTGLPHRFEVAEGPGSLQGALLETDPDGRAHSVRLVNTISSQTSSQ